MSTETWRPIPSLPGYEASDLGRIRSYRRQAPHILSTPVGALGYPVISPHGTPIRVHSLILEAFEGPRPEGLVTRHIDGDKTNNRLSNLKRGTSQENIADAIGHGTHVSVALAAKTHCPRLHPYTAENTYVYVKDGRFRSRNCRTCAAEAMRRFKQRSAA